MFLFLEMYKEIVDPKFTWQNFSKEEQNKLLTSDRSNNYLDTSKISSEYDIDHILFGIVKLFRRMKDNLVDG